VRTTDRRTVEREIVNRRGSPENPVTREDVERKFVGNLADLLAPDEINRLKSLALTLDKQANADEIVKIVGAAR
jgi:hypothetical protein